ncbi:hypothetical protein CEXT_786321 [Caerostris extrusa]|uniref:Uncharacterized protein n=1 Tax=Caerostris extrusa TaxID=172846 RepID=A0AAV4NN15_CAEEX|nr:hypothetical protein CEXT_786321 [Caerostris extrusa]
MHTDMEQYPLKIHGVPLTKLKKVWIIYSCVIHVVSIIVKNWPKIMDKDIEQSFFYFAGGGLGNVSTGFPTSGRRSLRKLWRSSNINKCWCRRMVPKKTDIDK